MSCGERPNVLSQFFVLPAVFFALPDQRLLLYGKLGGGGGELISIVSVSCPVASWPSLGTVTWIMKWQVEFLDR